MVRLLLGGGADLNRRGGSGRTARWRAAEAKKGAVVRLLSEQGAYDSDKPDINMDTNEALKGFVVGGFLTISRRLSNSYPETLPFGGGLRGCGLLF